MQCPNDQTTLAMTERQGIEIDYCPTCRGVWLDKGELDKLISNSERTPEAPAPTQSFQSPPPQHHQQPRYSDEPQRYNDDHGNYKKKHKKESFLGEIFDF